MLQSLHPDSGRAARSIYFIFILINEGRRTAATKFIITDLIQVCTSQQELYNWDTHRIRTITSSYASHNNKQHTTITSTVFLLQPLHLPTTWTLSRRDCECRHRPPLSFPFPCRFAATLNIPVWWRLPCTMEKGSGRGWSNVDLYGMGDRTSFPSYHSFEHFYSMREQTTDDFLLLFHCLVTQLLICLACYKKSLKMADFLPTESNINKSFFQSCPRVSRCHHPTRRRRANIPVHLPTNSSFWTNS